MQDRFEGKRVFVTGGARGIGAAIAIRFKTEGASVAIGARNSDSIDRFRADHGDEYSGVAADLSSRVNCHRAVDQAIAQLGGLDILVNSAGIFADVSIEAVTQEHWDETIATNLGGVFFCCQAALPTLIENRGNIVNIASDAALVAYSPAPAYGASKAGVVNLTQTLAYTLAKQVRVNCVCPGNVETDMLTQTADQTDDPQAYLAAARQRAPVGRMATPEEIAEAVAYFASDNAGFTTGAALAIDGGGVLGFD